MNGKAEIADGGRRVNGEALAIAPVAPACGRLMRCVKPELQ